MVSALVVISSMSGSEARGKKKAALLNKFTNVAQMLDVCVKEEKNLTRHWRHLCHGGVFHYTVVSKLFLVDGQ